LYVKKKKFTIKEKDLKEGVGVRNPVGGIGKFEHG
jgi:hypothetical protein